MFTDNHFLVCVELQLEASVAEVLITEVGYMLIRWLAWIFLTSCFQENNGKEEEHILKEWKRVRSQF